MSATVMQPSACPRCQGEGVLGHTTQSWCPDCRCVACGKELLGGGLCPPCDLDDMDARDTRRERRHN